MKDATPKYEDGKEAMITCPECGSPKLVVRTNTANGGQFLGCPNWPNCKHTQSIPESWKMRATGQPELF
jgi:ssDNA-binding Zn-finger/Zn-ribbon topoisomerase 1